MVKRNLILSSVIAVAVSVMTGANAATAQAQACQRNPIPETQIVEQIAADLKSAPPGEAEDRRYITLVNLVNACATDKQMQLYRHAVIKLLNSLSWQPEPARFETIDPHGAILRVPLGAIGWTKTEWSRLLRVYPYGLKPDSPDFQTITDLSGSPLPHLRGDWFTYAAARPPFYYRLLKLPKSFKALEDRLGPGAAQSIRSYWARRVRRKAATAATRVLSSRIEYSDKPFKRRPAGSSSSGLPANDNVRRVPRHVFSTSHFTLPNGFRAYFLHHSTGPRVDNSAVLPCRVCNFSSLRERAQSDGTVRMWSAGRYPVSAGMQEAIRDDDAQWARAQRAARLDPALSSERGLEPIRALGDRFARERVTMATAAAELGIDADRLESSMPKTDKKAFHTVRELAQHGLPRNRFQARFSGIAKSATDLMPLRNDQVGKYAGFGSSVPRIRRRRLGSGGFGLSLVSDKSAYTLGDTLYLSVRPQVSCNLTLVGVSADGSGVVLYPNRWRQDPFVPSGKIITVPDAFMPFRLHLRDKGTEKVYGFCNAHDRWTGLKHAFRKDPFTRIDDFDAYLKRREERRKAKAKRSGLALPPLVAETSITFKVD